MNRSQTIAEIIGGQPGTFVYDAPFQAVQSETDDRARETVADQQVSESSFVPVADRRPAQ